MPGGQPQPQGANPPRVFPTKAIRIVSLAPALSEKSASAASNIPSADDVDGQNASGQTLPGEDAWRTQAGLLQLLSMLGDQAGFDETDLEEDEWENVETGDEDDFSDEEANDDQEA